MAKEQLGAHLKILRFIHLINCLFLKNVPDDDYAVKMTLKEISGRETFPNIFLNGKTLGGSDDLEELHISGKLETLLIKNQLLLKKSN